MGQAGRHSGGRNGCVDEQDQGSTEALSGLVGTDCFLGRLIRQFERSQSVSAHPDTFQKVSENNPSLSALGEQLVVLRKCILGA